MVTNKIIVRDNGYNDLEKALKGLTKASKSKPRVDVGITQKAGSRSHGDATIAQIATWHEFGIGQEERSWLRGWYDEREVWIKAQIAGATKQVIQGKITTKQALEGLGTLFANDIKARIMNGGKFKENAESTIKRKGSSLPLFDEGIFVAAITHEVKGA